MQSFSVAMNFLWREGTCPIEIKGPVRTHLPLTRLQNILEKLLSSERNQTQLINKFSKYLVYDDILFYTWAILNPMTANKKSNPNEKYILNYLLLVEKLPLDRNAETKLFFASREYFTFNIRSFWRTLNDIWSQVMLWTHTPQSRAKLLIVVFERILHFLKEPLWWLLTDFLMDSLEMGGLVDVLALQGIFTMIQLHKMKYLDIFLKLYTMLEPETFVAKNMDRLLYLSDLFLSSTHLPNDIAAAFAKRLSRLALALPPNNAIICLMVVGNLIQRRVALKGNLLLDNPGVRMILDKCYNDLYLLNERDLRKSKANSSTLWEIAYMAKYYTRFNISIVAGVINTRVPINDWDLEFALTNVYRSEEDVFDSKLMTHGKAIALAFDKPKCAVSLKNILENIQD